MFPSEIFSQIGQYLPGDNYAMLSSTNNQLRKEMKLYRYSSFNMTEL